MQRSSLGGRLSRLHWKHVEPRNYIKDLVYVQAKWHQVLGNLTLSSVDALVLGNLLEVFDGLVHEVADVVDFSEDFGVGVPLHELLQFAVNHANAFNVARVVVNLLKLSKESVALFIVPC